MKKLFFFFSVFLLACCAPYKKDESVKADKGFFIVQKIDAVENDSSKVLSKYQLVSDTMVFESYIANEQQGYNPIKFFLTDTSGKYKIGDTLFLGLKIITDATY